MIRLADVHKLDMVDRLMRVAQLFPGEDKVGDPGKVRVIGWGFPNSNSQGDRWFDCRIEVEEPSGSKFHEWFEVVGRRSDVSDILNREVRDVANGLAEMYARRAS